MSAFGTPAPDKSARRNATVTISVPAACNASRITPYEENFPVPTIRRDENVRSAIFNGWPVIISPPL